MIEGITRRPEVWVNCAVSLDGRLAYAQGRRADLSSPEDLARVQRLRADSDAILVGVGTVVADDPSLRVHWEMLERPAGRAPWRIVLDPTGRTPVNARFLDGSVPTIVVTTDESTRSWPNAVRVLRIGARHIDLPHLFRELHDLGIRRVLIEGGARVLASVLRARLVDRLTVYIAPRLIGGTTAPPLMTGDECVGPDGVVPLRRVAVEPLGEGILLTFVPPDGPDPAAARPPSYVPPRVDAGAKEIT